MTVIAYDYRTKSIACDSLAVSAGKRSFVKKFRHLDDGRIVFIAGEFIELEYCVGRLNTGQTLSRQMIENCDVIVYDPKTGVCVAYDDSVVPRRVRKCEAWGTGGDFAVGSLMTGGDAEYAAKVAATHSDSCGGKVHVFRRINADTSRVGVGSVPVRQKPDGEVNSEQRGEGPCPQQPVCPSNLP